MISLIIPFFNEANRIHHFIHGLNCYQNKNQLIKEIILVNDGSNDATLSLLLDIKRNYTHLNISVIDNKTNYGKGYAIRSGIMKADSDWVLCNDADLSYSFDQIDEWYEKKWINLNSTNEVYFGKRILNDKESKFYIHRIIIGKIYYLFIRLIVGIRIKDTQCGFKLYRTDIANEIFSNLEHFRFAFDIEIILKLKKLNYNIILLPVKCAEVKGSKVNLIRDSISMFFALFKLSKYNR